MKIITTALAVATAAAVLSACATEDAGTSSGGSSEATSPYTVPQQNALESAETYLNMSGMSRAGVIAQLTSSDGDGYRSKDAVFAVNHIKVDWNTEAVQCARSYLDVGGTVTRAELIGLLTSRAGEQFTRAQAVYAANKVGL